MILKENSLIRFVISAILTGLLFGIMDGVINGNPYAVKLMECYKPIAKQTINIPLGLTIDLIYGFIISGIFILIMPVLPAENGILKGLAYGLGMWFFRVVMGVVSNYMMLNIPAKTLIYMALTGLIEMMILGMINGLIIKK